MAGGLLLDCSKSWEKTAVKENSSRNLVLTWPKRPQIEATKSPQLLRNGPAVEYQCKTRAPSVLRVSDSER